MYMSTSSKGEGAKLTTVLQSYVNGKTSNS